MPGMVINAGFGRDLDQVRADLDAVQVGLGKLIAQTAKDELRPIVSEVEQLLPFDPTHRGWKGWNPAGWKAKRDPGHIRASVRGGTTTKVLTVYTTHPGGPVHWWGGKIAPAGTTIEIRHRPGAGAEFTSKTSDKVANDLGRALDQLCAAHGL